MRSAIEMMPVCLRAPGEWRLKLRESGATVRKPVPA